MIEVFFFFLREFQPMVSTSDDNSLLSDQDTNQFLVYMAAVTTNTKKILVRIFGEKLVAIINY